MEDETVVGHEDPAKLPCRTLPASVRLRICRSQGEELRVITIEVKVPGIGPISSQHAIDRSRALARAISARLGPTFRAG